MPGLKDLNKKLSTLDRNQIEQGLLEIIQDSSRDIVALNTDRLFQGQTSEGGELPPYSPASVMFFGKPAGPWRLFDTGDFYNKFYVDTSKFPVVLNSSDKKTPLILKKLSDKGARDPNEIFGIHKDDLDELKEVLRSKVIKYFRDLLSIQ